MTIVSPRSLAATLILASGIIIGGLPQVAAFADPKIVATIDGSPITDQDIEIASADLAGNAPQMSAEAKRIYMIDYLIDLKLLAKAAAAEKIDQSEAFGRRLAYAKDRLLMERYMAQVEDRAVTPEAMKAFYDEQVKTIKPEMEVHARHILVPTEDEAKAILARLKAGEDFATLAAGLSKDPGSGKNGGDLGYFTKDRMVPEFAAAAFQTEPGKLSEIVKTQFGYHIIKVEDRRESTPPNFDDVKDQISQYMTQKAQQDVLLKLRAQAKIEKMDAPGATGAPAPIEPKKP